MLSILFIKIILVIMAGFILVSTGAAATWTLANGNWDDNASQGTPILIGLGLFLLIIAGKI